MSDDSLLNQILASFRENLIQTGELEEVFIDNLIKQLQDNKSKSENIQGSIRKLAQGKTNEGS